MALVKCSECGNNVSDRASRCPKCGCPIEFISNDVKQVEEASVIDEVKVEMKEEPVVEIKKEIKSKKKKIFFIILVVIVLILSGLGFGVLALFDFDLRQLKCEIFGCVTETVGSKYNGKYIRVLNEYINIRSDHVLNGNLLGKVKKDDYYMIEGYFEGYSYNWVYICYDGTNYGWVATPKDGDQYYEILEPLDVPDEKKN